MCSSSYTAWNGFLAHELDRILVAQVIAAFDGVIGVPLGMVFFIISQGCADAALRRAGVRTSRIQLADDGSLGRARGVQGRPLSLLRLRQRPRLQIDAFSFVPSYEVQIT